MATFDTFGLDVRILRILAKQSFKAPTPVQAACIAEALQGKDIIARSRTGSGKTLAYILPALHKIFTLPPQSQSVPWQVLILVPTQELCLQVKDEAEKLVKGSGIDIRVTALTAKGPNERQQYLSAGQIVVSTPGKIAHALRTGLVRPQAFQRHEGLKRPGLTSLILDEADLILSMHGYEADLQTLAPKIPRSCQCMLMSATTNESVEKLQKLMLQNPVTLNLLEESAAGASPDQAKQGEESLIEHSCIHCSREDKLLYTLALVKLNIVKRKVLLFANSIEHGFKLRLFLESFGIRSALVNAEQPMNSRHHMLQQFNKGIFDYLIAIDDAKVGEPELEDKQPKKSRAADKPKKRKREQDEEFGVTRGVDFKGVETVLNVDAPDQIATYVHRVGRTGRAGNSGTAITLLTPEDAEFEEGVTKHVKPSREQLATSADTGTNSEYSGLTEYSRLQKASVEALRYRAEDVARSLTSRAIKEARAKDLRQELLNSQKLAAHFEVNPGDMVVLKHDKPLAKRPEAPHLKHLPTYLRPAGGPQSIGTGNPLAAKKRRLHNKGVDPIKGGFLRAPKRGDRGDLTEMELKAEKAGKSGAKKYAKSQGKAFVPKRNVRKKR